MHLASRSWMKYADVSNHFTMDLARAFRSARARIVFAQLARPVRLMNYAGLHLAYKLKLKQVPFLPSTLDIEPNNICNFKCDHCQVTHWEKAPNQLDLETFRAILAHFPRLARIKLQGMGEPLLNKGLVEMLNEGEKRGISMRFTTNGSVCTDAMASDIAKLKHTFMTISVDGSNAEVFEKIRVKGNFSRVVSNIRRFIGARNESGVPKIDLWCVVTRQNLHQLTELVRLAKELKVDGITFQLFVSNWGKDSMNSHTDPLRMEPDAPELAEALGRARRVSEEEQVRLEIFDANLLSRKHKCPWPWKSAYVCSNGDVVPCCVIADSSVVKLGNVLEQPFSEIWNSEEYQSLREKIREHDLPSYCRNCYSDPPQLSEQSELRI